MFTKLRPEITYMNSYSLLVHHLQTNLPYCQFGAKKQKHMSSSDIRRYGNSGVHTTEGNVAGPAAARLTAQREKQQEEYSRKKQAIQDEHARGSRIDKNFQRHTDDYETEFKVRTRVDEIRNTHANVCH